MVKNLLLSVLFPTVSEGKAEGRDVVTACNEGGVTVNLPLKRSCC